MPNDRASGKRARSGDLRLRVFVPRGSISATRLAELPDDKSRREAIRIALEQFYAQPTTPVEVQLSRVGVDAVVDAILRRLPTMTKAMVPATLPPQADVFDSDLDAQGRFATRQDISLDPEPFAEFFQ